ncbi:MAG: IPExxxVDY family protein [Maribacter sp.]|nr:IPExxxVDY family protein [Maribacter sp.]NND80121.1 IPExxxVDY family protein [Maribacter sp.]NNK76642.1 IPExxxVDY family protein [Maribacter sp.]
MTAVHKIIGDFFEDSFTLIALHSSDEDYAMAYAINLCIKSIFKRSSKDLELSEHRSFPYFEWHDDQHDRYWALIANTSTKKEGLVREGLFKDETSFIKHHLVPEYKEVDYFIKIEHDDDLNEDKLLKSLIAIPKMVTAYSIDADKLKSKNNLIF